MSYYLYAFTASTTQVKAGQIGVAGMPLELIVGQGLAILAEEIPTQVFQNELEANAQNPQWLAEKAILHDTIINSYLSAGVLPLRFGTILEHKQAVLDLLEQKKDLQQRLTALKGKQEFAVRVWADKAVLTPRLIASDENLDDLAVQLDSTSGGKAYMIKKRLHEALERLFIQQMPTFRSIAFGQLADIVDQLVPFTRVPKNAPERIGILEAAVLLEPRSAMLLPAELEGWADRYGFIVELSGPFAPYNFVDDPESNP